MTETPQSRRLQIVFKDIGKSQRKFAAIFGISNTSIVRMLKGEQDINYTVIYNTCIKLGYSPTWLLLGTGDKKLKGNEAKLITEIQTLRMELDINAKLNMKLQARLTGIEREHEELKSQVSQLLSKKTV